MFIDLFYKLGASVVIVMGLIVLKLPTIAENQSIRTENALLMMAGCVTSVFFYVSNHYHVDINIIELSSMF